MQPNNNLSCIPFYTSLEEQDYRKWYAYGEKYIFKVPNNYLIPFFFVIPFAGTWTVSRVLAYKCDGLFVDITTAMRDNFLVVQAFDTYTEIIYLADPTTSLDLAKGEWYLAITVSNSSKNKTYYSDIFFVDSLSSIEQDCVELYWFNKDALECSGIVVPYGMEWGGDDFANRVYLPTDIGTPKYAFTEEGEERNGYFFPTKQISEKVYNMNFIAPEYLCDVMRLIRMADVVRITDKLGRVYNVEQFEMDVNWLEQGHYAEVGCAFQTDTVVKKVGKAYNNITNR